MSEYSLNNDKGFTFMNNKAVILCNLGSPDAPTPFSVKRYLNQFLMDPYVIQLPWWIRAILVRCFILPFRSQSSAKAYQSIWSEEGSPLVALSHQLTNKVNNALIEPVVLAMRYGKPSIQTGLLDLVKNKNINTIFFIPLYPHYAESTVATAIVELKRIIHDHQLNITFTIHPPFYKDSQYIQVLAKHFKNSVKKMALLSSDSDRFTPENALLSESSLKPHILFSYHGLPESHLLKSDITQKHCLKVTNCCQKSSPAHAYCYKHQVLTTTRLLVEQLHLQRKDYTITFQSRLGRAQWIEPSTDATLIMLAKRGIKNIIVFCPSFVTDCLETLEEIAIRSAETFKLAGGNSLRLIPCLNTSSDWINLLAHWSHEHFQTLEKESEKK
jgi:ferrochelatase